MIASMNAITSSARFVLATTAWLCVGIAAAQPAPKVASAQAACVPQWQAGWIRMPPAPGMAMAAGFGQFSNGCARAVAVVSASSPAFGDVSLHESIQVDGVNRMREVERLPVPAGGKAILSPGGLHLMLMAPTQPLREGDSVPVTFKLDDGGSVEATLQVRKTAP